MTKTLLFLFSVLAALPGLAAESNRLFRAGAALVDITPWLGVEINGNMHTRRATEVHDPLHARCLALDDGTNRLAIVLADSCMIYRETFDAAKRLVEQKTGLSATNIVMAATHTHSAGAAVSILQSEADADYQQFLVRRLADAVLLAMNRLQPATIGWAVGEEPNQVFNRRWHMQPGVINQDPFGGTNDRVRMNPPMGSPELLRPAGPTDPEVPVLAVRTPEGKPIALLANYSLHYVSGIAAGAISADYFGVFCRRIAELLEADGADSGFVALMSNGASGDCNNINFRARPTRVRPYEQIEIVGDAVARAAHSAYEHIQWQDWVPLRSVAREITLGVRRPAAEEVVAAQKALLTAERSGGQLKHREDIYRRETVLMASFPARTNLVLQAHRIGELGIVAIPCEVFVEIGLEIKKRSPLRPTFTIELANGYNGYLPTAEQHRLGGYETWRARSSYLEVEAAPQVTRTVLELLDQAARP